MSEYKKSEKKYKVCVFLDNGDHLFTYWTDDANQAIKLLDAVKLLFSDATLTEH